jgi:hypothetical protein
MGFFIEDITISSNGCENKLFYQFEYYFSPLINEDGKELGDLLIHKYVFNVVNVPMPNQLRFLYTFLSWYIYRHRPPNKSRNSHTKIAHVTIGSFSGKPARYSPKFFRLLRQVCRLTRKPKFRATPPQIRASENLIYWQVSTT